MNSYRYTFLATCPNNNRTISYQFTLWSPRMVMVEEIKSFCDSLKRGFHEDFADRLFAKFGCRQQLEAHHHGVDVETVRP